MISLAAIPLLLSATPVNNQLADLRNQISFIAGNDVARKDVADAAFAESLKRSIYSIVRDLINNIDIFIE